MLDASLLPLHGGIVCSCTDTTPLDQCCSDCLSGRFCELEVELAQAKASRSEWAKAAMAMQAQHTVELHEAIKASDALWSQLEQLGTWELCDERLEAANCSCRSTICRPAKRAA